MPLVYAVDTAPVSSKSWICGCRLPDEYILWWHCNLIDTTSIHQVYDFISEKGPILLVPKEVRWALCPLKWKIPETRCVDLPSGSRNVMTKGVLIKPGSSPRLQEIWWHPELHGPAKTLCNTNPSRICLQFLSKSNAFKCRIDKSLLSCCYHLQMCNSNHCKACKQSEPS